MEIKNYPKKIYALGNIRLLSNQHKVAIVGTRECSEYGREASFTFSQEMAKVGITIVSGLAIGIDALAHTAAIEEKGKTIAVLGGGFNKLYPKENEWLFNRIISQGGCVITEYGLNEEPNKTNFPKRNRIISGLSEAVLVVEAGPRSGSTVTARYAIEQKKKLYAIPGNIFSGRSVGTNLLLQTGKAKIATKPIQIIEETLQINFKNMNDESNINDKKSRKSKRSKTFKNVPEEKIKEYISSISLIPSNYQEIYGVLEKTSLYLEEIARTLNKSMAEISSTVTLMELNGYITKLATGQYCIV